MIINLFTIDTLSIIVYIFASICFIKIILYFIKNKFVLKEKQLILTLLIVFIIGIMIELVSKNNQLIHVASDYSNYIFAAIATISTLSVTILTIIINSLSDTYYGFQIKEIVNLRNDYFRIGYSVPLILFFVLFSAILLALNLTNMICIAFIISSLFITNLSVYIWKISTDSFFCKTLVKNYISKTNIDDFAIIQKLFSGLNNYLENKELDNLEKTINLIIIKLQILNTDLSKNDNTKNNFKIEINKNIRNIFKTAEIKYGLIFAIEKILKINNEILYLNDNSNKLKLIYDCIDRYQFLEDKTLYSIKDINIVKILTTNTIVDNKYKPSIIYKYFSIIYLNEILSKSLKGTILNDIVRNLVKYDYEPNEEYEKIKQKTLLLIISQFILLNENTEYANNLMGKLALTLHNNSFFNMDIIFENIAIVYQIIYLYSNHETETLSEEHRIFIQNLINMNDDKINKHPITFKLIIEEHLKEVEKALWDLNDEIYQENSFIEYFPYQFTSKTPVWEYSAGVTFSIYNYFLNWHDSSITLSNSKFWEAHKTHAIKMINMFDDKTKLLKEKHFNNIKSLSEWVDVVLILTEDIQKDIYRKIQIINTKIKVEEFNKVKTPSFDIKQVNNELYKLLEIDKIYNFNNSNSSFNQSIEYKFKLKIDNRFTDSEKDIAKFIHYYFIQFYNHFITNQLSNIEIGFDLASVIKLLDTLNQKEWQNTNFEYVKDLAFNADTRQDSNFKQLVEKNNTLNFIETPNINSRLYYKNNALDYNLSITNIEYIQMDESEIEKQVEDYKISEDIYKIETAYVDRTQAINFVKRIKSNHLVSFILRTNLDNESGFYITFNHHRY